MHSNDLRSAYGYCLTLASSHYENFPVASRLLPERLRYPIAAIYAFARTADDFADEGELSETERLAQLDDYATQLNAIARGSRSEAPLFLALADTIKTFNLPITLFHDLLSAFRQDVTQKRYGSFSELLDYCKRSANPVGRLLLHLHGDANEENLHYSDRICSALQLINFIQDLAQDFDENDRIYLPQDEMNELSIDESFIRNRKKSPEIAALIQRQISRAHEMMVAGAPLGGRLTGRFGFEIRLIVESGLRVLERLRDSADNIYSRPRLKRRDYAMILYRALFHRSDRFSTSMQPEGRELS